MANLPTLLRRRLPMLAASLLARGFVLSAAAATSAPRGAEASFLKENEAAMNTMMAAMAAPPSGDIDRDFVAMMAPHHQGAIDMARIYLRYGANEQLKRLAQEIIVTQQQEIAVMRLAIGEQPLSAPAPTAPGPTMHDMHMRQE